MRLAVCRTFHRAPPGLLLCMRICQRISCVLPLLFSFKQAFDSTVHFSTFFPLCALAATSENLVLVGNTERILIWNIVYSQLAIGNGGRRTAIEWTNGEYRLGRSPQKKGCSTSRRQHDIGQQERFRQRKRKYTD